MESIVIATPSHSGKFDYRYVTSLLQTFPLLSKNGYSVRWIPVPNMVIEQARNLICCKFLAIGAQKIVFIDDDIIWNPNDLLKILSYPEYVVGGVYPKKQNTLNFSTSLTSKEQKDKNKNENGLIETDQIPFGFLKIERQTLTTMAMKLEMKSFPYPNLDENESKYMFPFFQTDFTEDNGFISEDVFFCKKWIECKGQVWIDPTIQLGHIGNNVYQSDFENFINSFTEKNNG